MKKTNNLILTFTLLVVFAASAQAGETGNPPVMPVCNPAIQQCPQGIAAEPTPEPIQDTESAPADLSADVVEILVGWALSFIS